VLRDLIVFYIFNDNFDKKLNGHIITPEKVIVPVIPLNIEEDFIKQIIGI
jgi:hypothetical protein